MRIAIAGNIAAGKSTVQKILQDLGYKVLDTDVCGHNALKLECVKAEFVDYDVWNGGEISRNKLGKLVFENPAVKKKLENIVHPIIKENILEFFTQNRSENILFVAIPLIFETKMEDMFDKIVFIFADDELRLKRLIARNNYDENYAKLRINSQLNQKDKMQMSDYVITNNDSIEKLNLQVKSLLDRLT